MELIAHMILHVSKQRLWIALKLCLVIIAIVTNENSRHSRGIPARAP